MRCCVLWVCFIWIIFHTHMHTSTYTYTHTHTTYLLGNGELHEGILVHPLSFLLQLRVILGSLHGNGPHLEPLWLVGDPNLRVPLQEVAPLQLARLVHIVDGGLLLACARLLGFLCRPLLSVTVFITAILKVKGYVAVSSDPVMCRYSDFSLIVHLVDSP